MNIWIDNPEEELNKDNLLHLLELSRSNHENAVDRAERFRGFVGVVSGGEREYNRACEDRDAFARQIQNVEQALLRRFPDSDVEDEPSKEQTLLKKRRGRPKKE